MPEALGLRERKKLKTREAIVEAAFDLFEKQGFEATTVAEIAAAAEIAPRTFFSYFPSKEDVVFADFPEMIDAMMARVHDRAPGETAIDAMRAWIASIFNDPSLDEDRHRLRRKLVSESSALAARDRDLDGRCQTELAGALEEDLGDELQARMVAAAAVAALSSLEDDKMGEDRLAVIDQALDFVRGGIERLRARQPA